MKEQVKDLWITQGNTNFGASDFSTVPKQFLGAKFKITLIFCLSYLFLEIYAVIAIFYF